MKVASAPVDDANLVSYRGTGGAVCMALVKPTGGTGGCGDAINDSKNAIFVESERSEGRVLTYGTVPAEGASLEIKDGQASRYITLTEGYDEATSVRFFLNRENLFDGRVTLTARAADGTVVAERQAGGASVGPAGAPRTGIPIGSRSTRNASASHPGDTIVRDIAAVPLGHTVRTIHATGHLLSAACGLVGFDSRPVLLLDQDNPAEGRCIR